MKRFAFLLLLALAAPAQAQLYRGLDGAQLQAAIRAGYYPDQVLGYDRARDSLFLRVDLEPGDSLRDVYAGYTIHLDTGADPTVDAFAKGINTEHTSCSRWARPRSRCGATCTTSSR